MSANLGPSSHALPRCLPLGSAGAPVGSINYLHALGNAGSAADSNYQVGNIISGLSTVKSAIRQGTPTPGRLPDALAPLPPPTLGNRGAPATRGTSTPLTRCQQDRGLDLARRHKGGPALYLHHTTHSVTAFVCFVQTLSYVSPLPRRPKCPVTQAAT
jgi:hypothetical protein